MPRQVVLGRRLPRLVHEARGHVEGVHLVRAEQCLDEHALSIVAEEVEVLGAVCVRLRSMRVRQERGVRGMAGVEEVVPHVVAHEVVRHLTTKRSPMLSPLLEELCGALIMCVEVDGGAKRAGLHAQDEALGAAQNCQEHVDHVSADNVHAGEQQI